MAGTSNLNLFLIGLVIGGGAALVGGLAEYILHLRRKQGPQFGAPSCLVHVIGGLVLTGIVAIIGSLILTGGIGPALILGAGVMIGFYGGFILLVGAWLLLESRKKDDDGSASSDPPSA